MSGEGKDGKGGGGVNQSSEYNELRLMDSCLARVVVVESTELLQTYDMGWLSMIIFIRCFRRRKQRENYTIPT